METKIADVVHEVEGRYIVAHRDERGAQWQSSDIGERPFEGYRYTYAGSLEGLVREGIRTYATREEAVAAAHEAYLIDDEDEV